MLGLAGCGPLMVTRTTPHPNLVSAPERTPAQLTFSDAILDGFAIPETGTVRTVQVTGWRGTLEDAFQSAFPSGGVSGLTLELVSTELTFTPLAMDSTGTTRAVKAVIRFRARLLSEGTEIAVVAGTAEAREAITSPSTAEMTRSAGQAVEAMFEAIAAEIMLPSPVVAAPEPAAVEATPAEATPAEAAPVAAPSRPRTRRR